MLPVAEKAPLVFEKFAIFIPEPFTTILPPEKLKIVCLSEKASTLEIADAVIFLHCSIFKLWLSSIKNSRTFIRALYRRGL